ncbi:hypothetical protein BV22DRAFT_44818, partial [Leucogyrophana mollusca]
PSSKTDLCSHSELFLLQQCPLRGDIRKIGTIQRRLAWPLHKDDTLSRSGRPTGLNIYCFLCQEFAEQPDTMVKYAPFTLYYTVIVVLIDLF